MRPAPKGWCPSALKPMASGDGLIVRLRPKFGRITRKVLLSLLDLSENYGNGLLDFTNRANLQIRGVSEGQHTSLIEALYDMGLIDDIIEGSGGRNIILTPTWLEGGLTETLAKEFYASVNCLPTLPSKFGFSIDTEAECSLMKVSSDIRIERSNINGLVVRADGSDLGRAVSAKNAVTAMFEMARWFIETNGVDSGRMVHHLRKTNLPRSWQTTRPLNIAQSLPNRKNTLGVFLGITFGQTSATALRGLINDSKVRAIRLTPWRSILLEGTEYIEPRHFTFCQANELRAVYACPGAPACSNASIETRELAAKLAKITTKPLHISGCSKGCALPKSASVTITGYNASYDLTINGCAWDKPIKKGMSMSELFEYIERL